MGLKCTLDRGKIGEKSLMFFLQIAYCSLDAGFIN
jgi:hypothetical protein